MSQTNPNRGNLLFVEVTRCLGVQASKFHGKTRVPGQIGSLSRFEKQTEKVLIFLTTAVLLMFLLVPAASASAVITPGGDPGRTPSNMFDYSNVTVGSNSATYNSQSNILDVFGGSFSTLEAPGRTIFADYAGAYVTYVINFTTNSPVSLNGYSLYLAEDVGSLNRSATDFVLVANGQVISNVALATVGSSYAVKFGSDSSKVSDSFAPISATTFQAVFYSNTGFNDGVRVMGFQGFGSIQGGVSTNPEPATISLALLAGVAFAAFYRRRMAR